MINDYLFRDLGYRTPLTYRPSNDVFGGVGLEAQCRRPRRAAAAADTSVDLADGDARRTRELKVLSVNGLLRPRDAVRTAPNMTFRHMALGPAELQNIRYNYYPAGHMMYIDPVSARQFKADLAGFYASAHVGK